MAVRLVHWPPSRLGALWAGGLLLEGALLLLMSAVLVRPDPPLVARLRGENRGVVQVVTFAWDSTAPHSSTLRQVEPTAPVAEEDSFYTVVHWPLDKPLLEGGGHVVAVPMRYAWVPVLFVTAVPLALLAITGAWVWSRRRTAGVDSNA